MLKNTLNKTPKKQNVSHKTFYNQINIPLCFKDIYGLQIFKICLIFHIYNKNFYQNLSTNQQ